MVVNDSDLMSTTIAPFEYHAPLIVHPDRMEVLQSALQLFESIRRWHLQVLEPTRRVEGFELALCATSDALELAHELVGEQFFGLPVTERTNHVTSRYTVPRYAVNQGFALPATIGRPSFSTSDQLTPRP